MQLKEFMLADNGAGLQAHSLNGKVGHGAKPGTSAAAALLVLLRHYCRAKAGLQGLPGMALM